MDGTNFKPNADEVTAQAAAVLVALRGGARTTIELRELGCMSPAARILDLRKAGHRIVSFRRGRQALYSLDAGEAS